MIPSDLIDRYQSLRHTCEHHLTGHPPMSMTSQLESMAEQAQGFTGPDVYGKGELIESFEAELAALLGKPAAVFLPSGTMAQCIALRIWADRAGSRNVGFHATSHLQLHEQQAYSTLYGLEAQLLGEPQRVVSLTDLQAMTGQVAAVLLELPLREIGGRLPDWHALESQSKWAREGGVALHLDGARLWQCTPYYNRSLAEIAALFDSVYVSLYKDIGGVAGAVLAGPADFIEEARLWIRRSGGNLHTLFPLVLAARAGMARNLNEIPAAVTDASWLADTLNAINGLETLPKEPPTNLFHLPVPGDPLAFLQRACEWTERNRVFLMPPPRINIDGRYIMEFSIGQAIRTASKAQWAAWLDDFFELT